jgi:sulfatase maturation enzyme AslB (radical SAM superfamily)
MTDGNLNKIIDFAQKHYKHIFFTGGEPTLDPRLFTIAKKYPEIIFFIFTNGSTINDSYAKHLSYYGNLIPLIGIDGLSESSHDNLRGTGSFKEVHIAINSLNKYNVTWGCLTLVTELNACEVLGDKFIHDKINKRASFLRFLEYIPVGPNPLRELILSGETYYNLEKRKKKVIQNGGIYMQETTQKKCTGLLFFSADGFIKNCFSFHYAKYNIYTDTLQLSIAKLKNDWNSFSWNGECPLYSDPHGLKNHLDALGWTHQSTVPEPYLIDPSLAQLLTHNYKKYLKLVSEKGS